MRQPDEEYTQILRPVPHWTAWFIPSFALACTGAIYVSNVIWGASRTEAQIAQLSNTVDSHTKQMTVLQDEVTQERTSSAVILERIDNIKSAVDQIRADQQEFMRRKDQK